MVLELQTICSINLNAPPTSGKSIHTVKAMMLSSKYPVFTLHQGNHCSSSKPTQKTSLATTNTVLAHNGVPRSTCLPQEHSHGPQVLGNLHPSEQLAPRSNSVAQEHWHNVPPVPREHWSHGPPVSPWNIGPLEHWPHGPPVSPGNIRPVVHQSPGNINPVAHPHTRE